MALDNFANFVRGSLTAAVTDTDTIFPVNNASIFPDPAAANTTSWCGTWAVTPGPIKTPTWRSSA